MADHFADHFAFMPTILLLKVSVDDSKGTPFNESRDDWSYEWDWKFFVPYADCNRKAISPPGIIC